MQILNGTDLAAAVMELFEGQGRPRCAVAFWGPRLAQRARSRNAEVILDISMGGTSRNALMAFGLEESELPIVDSKVRVLDGLHAKIFIDEQRAIIGSANASCNALGWDGRAPSLEEAGVLIDRLEDREAYLRLEEIYGQYEAKARAIDKEDFKRAVRVAGTPASRDYGTNTVANSPSIFRELLERPRAFAQTTFICGDRDFESQGVVDEADEVYEGKIGEAPKVRGRSIICQFPNQPTEDAKLRGAREVMMFWFGSRPGIAAYHDIVRIEHDDKSMSYFGRKSWPDVRKSIGMSGTTSTELWREDKVLALKIAESAGDEEDDRFVVLTSGELYEMLEQVCETER